MPKQKIKNKTLKTKSKKALKNHIKLSAEEQAMLHSIEQSEWQSVKNLKEEIEKAKEAAHHYFL